MENEKKTIFCMKNRFFPSKILFDLIMVSISTFICSFLQSLQWFQFNMTFKNNIKYSWNNIEYLIRSQNRSSESNNIEAKNYHVHVDEHFVYFLVLYEYFVDKIHTSIRMKKKNNWRNAHQMTIRKHFDWHFLWRHSIHTLYSQKHIKIVCFYSK